MTRLTLDNATCAVLGNVTRRVELCDESGRILGFFTPLADSLHYQDIQPQVSDEELDRREREQGGRSLEDILTDLHNQG